MRWTVTFGALVLVACNQQPASEQAGAATAQQEVPAEAADSEGRTAEQVITCHLLIGGRPSPEPTIYELVGADFYSKSPGADRQLISSEGKLVHLSRTQDDEGPQDSFASHTVEGNILTRTVLWQRPGQAPRTAFVDRYDFRRQTVVDAETGQDSCHHDAQPDGRTQEQAEWEALSGTGRGDMLSETTND